MKQADAGIPNGCLRQNVCAGFQKVAVNSGEKAAKWKQRFLGPADLARRAKSRYKGVLKVICPAEISDGPEQKIAGA